MRVSEEPFSDGGESGGPQQARADRPNPCWPQEPKVQAMVARVRSIIAANPDVLRDCNSPVTDIVFNITDDDLLGCHVIEGVLADSACRFMLNSIGLHCGGKKSTRRTKQ